MKEQPKFLSISQASKISGIAKSSIIHHIKNGLYGTVKETKQGKRPVKQISTDRFLAACKDKDIEIDWTTLDRSKNRSVKRATNDQLIDQKSVDNNDLKETLNALEEQYKARLAEKDEELKRAHLEADRAKNEASTERQQAASEREQAALERRELNQARNFFEAQRNFLLGRIEGLGRGDGWRLLTGRKLQLELPAQSKDGSEEEIIETEAEEVTVAEQKAAAQT